MGLGDRYEISYVVRSTGRGRRWRELYDAVPHGIAAPSRASAGRARRRIGRWSCTSKLSASGAGATSSATSRCASRHAAGSSLASRASTRRQRRLSCRRSPTCGGCGCSRCSIGLSDAGVRALKQRGEGTAFAGLRDYVPGDDPRLLDWKATARHARLITREQSIERSQTVVAMIDCGRAMTQLAGTLLALRARAVGGARAERRRRGERRSRRTARVRRRRSRVRSAAEGTRGAAQPADRVERSRCDAHGAGLRVGVSGARGAPATAGARRVLHRRHRYARGAALSRPRRRAPRGGICSSSSRYRTRRCSPRLDRARRARRRSTEAPPRKS